MSQTKIPTPTHPLRYLYHDPAGYFHWSDAHNLPWKSSTPDANTLMTPEFHGPHTSHPKAPVTARSRRLFSVIVNNIRGIDKDPDSDDERYAAEHMMRTDTGYSRMSIKCISEGVRGATGRKGRRGRKGGDSECSSSSGEGRWVGSGMGGSGNESV